MAPRKQAKKSKKLMFLSTHSPDQLVALGRSATMGATAEEGKILMKWMGGSQPSRLAKTRTQNKKIAEIMKPSTSKRSTSAKPKTPAKATKKTPVKSALKKTKKTTSTKKQTKKVTPKTKGKKKLMFLQTHTPGELAALGKQVTMGATAEEGQQLLKWMGKPKSGGRTRQTAKKSPRKSGKK